MMMQQQQQQQWWLMVRNVHGGAWRGGGDLCICWGSRGVCTATAAPQLATLVSSRQQ
jgi:hypothetical protein